jgi:hypothetical protein
MLLERGLHIVTAFIFISKNDEMNYKSPVDSIDSLTLLRTHQKVMVLPQRLDKEN